MTDQILYVIMAFAFAIFSLTALMGLTLFRDKSLRKQLEEANDREG